MFGRIGSLIKARKRFLISVFDQGVYSTANYLLGVILFRVLNLEEYGLFTFSYSVFLFFTFLFYAGIIEPLAIYGVKRKNKMRIAYNSASIVNLILLILIFLVVLLLISPWLFGNSKIDGIHISLSIATAMLVNFTFISLRRIEYNQHNQVAPFFSSIVYFSVLIIGVCLTLLFKKQLDAQTITSKICIIYGFITLASIAGIIFFRKHIASYVRVLKEMSTGYIFRVIKMNSGIAKWMYMNCVFLWLTRYFFSVYLGYTDGFNNMGILKQIENLFLPIEQFITALSIVVLPTAIAFESASKSKAYIGKISLYLSTGLICYIFLTSFFFTAIAKFLYGTSEFQGNAYLLIAGFGFVTLTRIITDFYFGLQFRMLRQHRFLLITSAITFLIVFFPGKILLNEYGLNGVAMTFFLMGIIQILISLLLINRFTLSK